MHFDIDVPKNVLAVVIGAPETVLEGSYIEPQADLASYRASAPHQPRGRGRAAYSVPALPLQLSARAASYLDASVASVAVLGLAMNRPQSPRLFSPFDEDEHDRIDAKGPSIDVFAVDVDADATRK